MRYQFRRIWRSAQLGLVALATTLTSLNALPAHAQEDPNTSRSFSDTGYQIQDDAVWSFFASRGGASTFGRPISQEFILNSEQIQLFERGALQVQPDGSVTAVDLAGPGFLPYTHFDGSRVPPADPALTMVAPDPDRPDFRSRSLEFLHATVPDVWQGIPVQFFSSIELQVLGLPTSSPTIDPSNARFVYQRFQNGILQFDATQRTTQGLLLGDYVKAVLTGQNLPSDLEVEAAQSPLLRQYEPSQEHSLARPASLRGSDLTNAFVPDAP